jgi:tetratricopeptide (TPR) repeat protein
MSTLREILDLYDAAETAFDNGQILHSADLYQRAEKLAVVYQGSEEVSGRYAVVFRRAEVHSLVCAEKLREALAVLAPLAEADRQARMNSCCVYGTTTDQIIIGQDLPVSLGTIEKTFGHAESYALTTGNSNWRSKTLHLRARLYFLRGMFEKALAAAQEGWALWQDGCPAFFATTHLQTLFDICLASRDVRGAQKYLAKWEPHEKKKSRLGDATFYSMQSRLARMKGQLKEALDYARRAVQTIEIADWSEMRYAASCTLVRALIVAGEHERARDTLARLMHMRRSESGHDRYALQLLRGDYHLSRARLAAGLAQADDEYDVEFPQPRGNRTSHAQGHELKQARASYHAALITGQWIDEQLQCTFRQREVSERLARAKQLERQN